MDAQVEMCRSCGQVVGVGRFCFSCGRSNGAAPDGDVDTTAERAAVSPGPTGPTPPPPVHLPPQPARFPLFADEVPRPSTDEAPVAGRSAPAPEPILLAPTPQHARSRSRAAGLGWAAAAVAVVALLGAGGALLLSGSGDGSEQTLGDVTGSAGAPAPTDDQEPTAPSPTPAATPAPSAEPVDVASRAEATPPDTAPPSVDVRGNAVRYEAFNMLDGQPDTAWRTPGDAAGQEILFRLDGPTAISSLGLINGYAKVDPGYDGYAANRRITRVEWVLGDGTVVPQDLADGTLDVQDVGVDDVVSDTLVLRILEVTAPARGPAGRDFTAISDVAVVGSPA